MKFALRKRTANIVLGVGQSKRYMLPPMTAGYMQISVHSVFMPNEAEPPDDGTGTPPPDIFNRGMVEAGRAEAGRAGADAGAGTAAGDGSAGLWVVARDNPLNTGNPATDLDLDPGGGNGGGGVGPGTDSGPSPDIKLELKRNRRTIAEGNPAHGTLIHEAVASGSDWNIIITRKQDAFPQRRRFRVVVTYHSILPEEDRRIPLAFLRQGFDLNWNQLDGQYFKDLWIEDNTLTYYLDPVFAALYHLAPDNQNNRVDLGTDSSIRLPTIRKDGPVEFQVGVDTETDMALGGPRVYVAVKATFVCEGSRSITLPSIIPDADLPQTFWAEARFYFAFLEGGTLFFEPRILTDLTIDYFVAEDTINEFLTDALKDVEMALFDWQWGDSHQSVFDKHLKPWLVGNYEVTGLHYDAATDELVIRHVGKPVKRPMTLAADPDAPTGGGWNMINNPRPAPLFLETKSEVWDAEDPPGADPGPLRPTSRPGNLEKIDHIVVLMQENRSFDHILGHLSRDLGHDEVEGLLPDDSRDWNDCDILAWRDQGIRFTSRRITDTSWPASVENPCHGHHCTMRQMSDGMKHFVSDFSERAPNRADAQRVMDYFGDGTLKAYDGLKRTFAICDHWFGSHIGGTLPNRHITFSGDLNRDELGAPEEENSELGTYCPSERQTFFDLLTKAGVSWRLYEHGYSFLRLYRNYTFDITSIRPFAEFLTAAHSGLLPQVTFIEPDYIEAPNGNDDHAPADMAEGQRLVGKIVRALINGPKWDKTLLIITYDEHGGMYDHLTPPESIDEVQEDGTTTTRRIPPLANAIRQLGPRVPAFVISPYTPGERPNPDGATPPTRLNVSKTVFEHASIPATILRKFCGPRTPYLSDRVDAAHDVGSLLSLDQARPSSDYAELLALLEQAINAPASEPVIHAPPPPLRKKLPGTLGETEDFHGFIAYASSVTGRS